ncbi:hypothetical protein SBD_0138 [Streptomyces bottropensis ATCC 25435]|uniref:Uncharacterized protein n=1 Tax=Streptomyces bottropensis ATCC 25435 TaxID=1054862 RepID=M3FWR9_9ACTN|nr:hypothetical protein SBD_0138 [Streptomyces bottropensis ATCC 25435]
MRVVHEGAPKHGGGQGEVGDAISWAGRRSGSGGVRHNCGTGPAQVPARPLRASSWPAAQLPRRLNSELAFDDEPPATTGRRWMPRGVEARRARVHLGPLAPSAQQARTIVRACCRCRNRVRCSETHEVAQAPLPVRIPLRGGGHPRSDRTGSRATGHAETLRMRRKPGMRMRRLSPAPCMNALRDRRLKGKRCSSSDGASSSPTTWPHGTASRRQPAPAAPQRANLRLLT